MRIDFEIDFSGITSELEKMEKGIQDVEEKATKKAAQVVADTVKKKLNRSSKNYPGYAHMEDDVRISGLKEDENGNKTRVVSGGKRTKYKWKFLEYGTSRMQGNQFASRATKETEGKVKEIVEAEIKSQLGL